MINSTIVSESKWRLQPTRDIHRSTAWYCVPDRVLGLIEICGCVQIRNGSLTKACCDESRLGLYRTPDFRNDCRLLICRPPLRCMLLEMLSKKQRIGVQNVALKALSAFVAISASTLIKNDRSWSAAVPQSTCRVSRASYPENHWMSRRYD